MNKKLVSLLLVTLLMISGIGIVYGNNAWDYERIHFNSTVVDTHNDTMMRVINSTSWQPEYDLYNLNRQINLQKVHEGGLDVGFYAAYTGYQGNTQFFIDKYGYEGRMARTNSRMLSLINALYWNENNNSDLMTIETSLKNIEKAIRDGKHVAVPTLEGMYSFEDYNAHELLEQYYDLGIRAAAMVWNPANALAAGTSVANDAPNAGLTELGKEMVKEMNRLGIVVDVSHMNETSFFDTVATSKAPIIASHSGVDAIREHVRNLSDAQLLAIKENGGIAQVNFWDAVVAPVGETATISYLVDHIDHIVDLIGIDHVGIGSDFDGASMPVDLQDASYLPDLTKVLVDRGYSRQDIEKILGGNTLDLIKEVEKIAEKDSSRVGQGLTITPSFEMGEIFESTTPLLTAKVSCDRGSQINEDNFKVIVDGISYEPTFEANTGTLSLLLEEELLGSGPLNEDGTQEMTGNYHVVTFEAVNSAGKISRETVIFYVK